MRLILETSYPLLDLVSPVTGCYATFFATARKVRKRCVTSPINGGKGDYQRLSFASSFHSKGMRSFLVGDCTSSAMLRVTEI